MCLLGRLLNIFPLAGWLNWTSSVKITLKMQCIMWFSGLRGAIAFALAIRNTSTPAHQTILTATLVVVLITVVFFGGSTVALLQWLRIKYAGHATRWPRSVRRAALFLFPLFNFFLLPGP